MSYFLAPAGKRLFADANAMFPHRDKASDGWVGDTSHQARKSEHNPCWSCSGRNYGIVLATDIDISPDGRADLDLRTLLLKELIGDPRVWYVISNRVIYSRTYGWAARTYTGSNPHDKHVHSSFLIDRAWDDSPFFGPQKPKPVKPLLLDMSRLEDAFLRVIRENKTPQENVMVRRYQRLLVREGFDVQPDGVLGPITLRASGGLEKRYGGVGRPRVPDEVLLKKANKGLFRLAA